MRGQWEGGKGSVSRVTDWEAYYANLSKLYPSKIKQDKQDNQQEYYLFLDDNRSPKEACLWGYNRKRLIDESGIPNGSWLIVRSYDEFVNCIDTRGIPKVVSFDNDLVNFFEEDFSADEVQKLFTMKDWETFLIKTGAHCAEYLVKRCNALGKPVPKYYIHTANTAAYPIIKSILENGRVQ